MQRRTRIGFCLAALLCVTSAAHAQPKADNAVSPKPAQIDRNGTLILIRTALLALHQGNETGNYTVLRDLAAPGFREGNTAARLGEIFASQRAQKLDLSGVAVLDPQLTLLPQIEPNGLLHMAGFFPSVPSQVNFELLFAAVEGRWRVFGISVNIGSSAPVAPTPPQGATAPPHQAEAKGERKRETSRAEPSSGAAKGSGRSAKPAVSEPSIEPGK